MPPAPYETFLTTLTPLTTPPPDPTCPICLTPYSSSSPSPSLTLLQHLPFPSPQQTDHPVHLPCTHILGSICLSTWLATGASTCPLARCQLFPPSTSNSNQHPPPALQNWLREFDGIERRPLRGWIKEEWRDEDVVRMSSKPMRISLSTIMIRIACRLTRVPEHEVLRIWHAARREWYPVSGTDVKSSVWPAVSMVGCDTGEDEIGVHAGRYKELIAALAAGAELDDQGRYPEFLRVLLDERAGRMYEGLCREVCARYDARCAVEVRVKELYDAMFDAVMREWGLGMLEVPDRRWRVFLDLVLRVWIGQERAMTALRKEMQGMDG